MGNIYFAAPESCELQRSELKAKIAKSARLLADLQAMALLLGSSTTGDAEFDVELTVAINVTRAGLLRLRAMLGEKAGDLDVGDLPELTEDDLPGIIRRAIP